MMPNQNQTNENSIPEKEANRCLKCNTNIESNYCPNCGHPLKLDRINGRYILKEIGSVLNLQKGILFTIKELTIRPGKSIRQFIEEDRNRLVKPILFILICSFIYTISVQIFHFHDGYMHAAYDEWENNYTARISNWVSANYGYSNLLMALFIAGWIKIFFRKYNYNYFEILILLCFIMGMEMLFLAILGAIEGLSHISILDWAVSLVLIYGFWAIGQFFDERKFKNYLKAFASYFLGMITFILITSTIGALLDIFF